ncbi:MAG: acetyl-CoA carboxylase biotin carboxylase subunit [Betaproteobacteria bacterium]|nr:acetyl-CoA carboxylase biotin carboxylase subunit [Betaproteobacteria bacterium]
MFDKVLIANRGEIACRIARTAKRLGIRTVAVHSEADARAMHVSVCDEAFLIGPPAARDSYLRSDRILEAAQRAGADAIHPGYGFLSENADFAEAVEGAGLVFVGPPASAIRAMGSKSNSKAIMAAAGVPLVPGYHGESQDAEELATEAGRIGYPVLIKASAGGGGKGMRIVRDARAFADALASARREAASAFGDDRILVEKYLERPRHVEMQVFADTHGNALHLFERDCSVQRRHQKVLEEAPAPGLDGQRRRQMGSAALAAARAVNYVGAGTVEFILDATGQFFFMEMNTRLQVEHPVTEMITGIDLVEWQLRVAAGEPLPLAQDQVPLHGHAIEARIYAEDPARDFLPAIGRLDHLREPARSEHVRVDTGVREGDDISPHYDPMIAKLVCWDLDRAGALRRMRRALADYEIAGVTTNLDFLASVVTHRAFAEAHHDPGLLDTGLIERYRSELFEDRGPAGDDVIAVAALSRLLASRSRARERASRSSDPYSPWNLATGWRLNEDNHHALEFRDGERQVAVIAHFRARGYELELNGRRVFVDGEEIGDGTLAVTIDGARLLVRTVVRGNEITIFAHGRSHRLALHTREAERDAGDGGSLVSPMPGTVIGVLVRPGDVVERGARLMLVEAMKMEHTITAPGAGVVREIFFAPGDPVGEGVELLAFEPASPTHDEEGKR